MCKNKNALSFLLLTLLSMNYFYSQEVSYTYSDLREALYANNPDILKQSEEYYRSTLDVLDAWWTLGPTLNASAVGNYMFNPPSVNYSIDSDEIINSIEWPKIMGQSTKPNVSNRQIKIDESLDHTLYSFSLSLKQPLFTWGKITNAIKLYQGVSEAQRLQLNITESRLETELETRLTSLFYLQKILKILEEEYNYASQLVSFSELAEQNGMMIHQEVLDAKLQAKQIQIAQQNVNEQVSTQLLELQKLTRIQNLSLENIDYSFDEALIKRITLLDREQVKEKALSSESETIQLLLQTQNLQDIALKIAKASVNWKPDIALQISLGYGGTKFPFFEDGWKDADDYSLNFTIGITTSVWDGGNKVRDVSRKLSQQRSAQIESEDAKIQIQHTLDTQWNTVDASSLRIEYQDLKIENAHLKIEQQELMYKNGYASESDVLFAKIDWCNERITREQEALNVAVAAYTILYLSK